MLLFAGALLLTPGFITDAVGFIILFRPTRSALAQWFIARSAVRVQQGFGAGGFGPGMQGGFGSPPGATPGARGPGGPQRRPGSGGVIEGEFTHEDKR